jgi:hypothetical protein
MKKLLTILFALCVASGLFANPNQEKGGTVSSGLIMVGHHQQSAFGVRLSYG